MPVLKNARHERFAQELAKGKSQTAAYKAAGYKGGRSSAAHLATKSNISIRVAELQGQVAKKVVLSRADILAKLAENAELARGKDQISAANQALRLYGQELGMFVNRHLVGTKRIEDMTEAELIALAGEDADA